MIGNLLVKLSERRPLNPSEKEELRLWGNQSQLSNSYVAGLQNGGNTYLTSPIIETPIWGGSPLGAYTFQVQTDTVIPNNTDTVVTFDTFLGYSNYFKVDPSDLSKIRVVKKGARFFVGGTCEWATNSTGIRNIKLFGFDNENNSIGFVGLNQVPATPVTAVTLLNAVFVVMEMPELAYFKITVAQNSGADLTMNYLLMFMFLV